MLTLLEGGKGKEGGRIETLWRKERGWRKGGRIGKYTCTTKLIILSLLSALNVLPLFLFFLSEVCLWYCKTPLLFTIYITVP